MSYRFCLLDSTPRIIQGDGLSDITQNLLFTLDAIPYYIAMSRLFQYYKFGQIDVVYRPLITEVVALQSNNAVNAFTVPDLVYCNNFYSASFSTYAAIQQRGDAQVVSSLEPWIHSLTPVPLMRSFGTTLADGFTNEGPQWISTANPGVPHYGLSIAIEPSLSGGATPTFGGRLEVYVNMYFKNPVFQE